MLFRKLVVNIDGKLTVLDGYEVKSEVSDYSQRKESGNEVIVRYNPNVGSIFDLDTFKKVMESTDGFDVSFGVRYCSLGLEDKNDLYWFKPEDVIDWEIF